MNWPQLTPPPVYNWHSKKVAKLRKELADEISEILDQRRQYDAHREKLQNTPLDEVKTDDVFQMDVPKLTRFDILQRELRMRRRLVEFNDLLEADRQKAYSNAIEAHEAKKAEIEERLLSIGYVKRIVGGPQIGAVLPGYVLSHPEVHAAKLLTDSLRTPTTSLIDENNQVIAGLEHTMDQLRSRALASS